MRDTGCGIRVAGCGPVPPVARASSPEPSEVCSRPGHEERFVQPWSFRDPASHGHGLEAPCHVGDILLASSGLWVTACMGVSEQDAGYEMRGTSNIGRPTSNIEPGRALRSSFAIASRGSGSRRGEPRNRRMTNVERGSPYLAFCESEGACSVPGGGKVRPMVMLAPDQARSTRGPLSQTADYRGRAGERGGPGGRGSRRAGARTGHARVPETSQAPARNGPWSSLARGSSRLGRDSPSWAARTPGGLPSRGIARGPRRARRTLRGSVGVRRIVSRTHGAGGSVRTSAAWCSGRVRASFEWRESTEMGLERQVGYRILFFFLSMDAEASGGGRA